MKRLLILLVLITCTAQAEIYKSQNEKGEWVYSDKPSPSAERMKLPPLSTYKSPPLRTSGSPPPKAIENDIYAGFSFIKPVNDETLRNNLGIVMAETKLVPALQHKLKHRIQFYLDNEPYGPVIASTAVTMSNLDRGAHTLSASVVDQEGNTLISTGSVTVHVKRESKLNVIDDAVPTPLDPANPNIKTENPNIRTPNPNILSPNPNVLSPNPNILSPNPNILSPNPNVLSPNPNIINSPKP